MTSFIYLIPVKTNLLSLLFIDTQFAISIIIEPAEEKDNGGGTSLPSPPRGRSPDHLKWDFALER